LVVASTLKLAVVENGSTFAGRLVPSPKTWPMKTVTLCSPSDKVGKTACPSKVVST
jgi:hypothetical protein